MAEKKSLATMQVEVEQLSSEIERLLSNVKKRGVANFTTRYLEGRVTKLNEYYTKALDFHCEVVAATTIESREQDPYFNNNVIETLQARFDKADDYLSEQLDAIIASEIAPSDVSHLNRSMSAPIDNSSIQVRLPQIDLPKFAGEIDKWPEFRDLYTALVHDNTSLSDVQKLQYLSSCLTGDAKQTVASLSLVSANYKVECELLKDRYENKRVLVSTLFHRLSDMPSIRSENLSEIKTLRTTYTVVLESIKKLKISVENWDPLVIHLLTLKFDKALKREWEISMSNTKELPTLKQFDEFLNTQIRILDALAIKTSSSSPFDTPIRRKAVHTVTTEVKPSQKKASLTVSQTVPPQVKQANKPKCPLCQQAHFLTQCQIFTNKSPKQRFDEVKRLKLCTNCLSSKHSLLFCESKNTCRTCNKRHHSMLHFLPEQTKTNSSNTPQIQTSLTSDTPPTTSSQTTVGNVTSHTLSVNLAKVLLATASVVVRAPSGHAVNCRALIDQGSEVSFVSESVAQALRLPRVQTEMGVTGLGCLFEAKIDSLVELKIAPHFASETVVDVQALVLQTITDYNPTKVDFPNINQLNDLQLADPHFTTLDKIDILIGADVFGLILLDGIKRLGGSLIAQNTKLGWVISGRVQSKSSVTVTSHHISLTELSKQLTSFWEIEEIHKPDLLSAEEENCEQHFQSTYSRTLEGRFMVKLPFKIGKDRSALGRSEHIAMATLTRLKARLQSNDKLRIAYHDFLREYEELDHMRKLGKKSRNDLRVFIPHQGVIREDKLTTKLRVVFNASCPTSTGVSLNDVLAIGPKLQTDITGVLLKWRRHRYVFCSDIEKMFRQILVHPCDRDLQNILWFNPETDQVQKYELSTVTYGTGPAPYLAIRVIDEIAKLTKRDFPLAYPVLTQNRYVDDLMFGADDKQLLKETRSQVERALGTGGFLLKKWHSNSIDVLTVQDVNENAVLAEGKDDNLVKLLGINWDSRDDTLRMKIKPIELTSTTKRQILSDIAKLFDPLGWLSPLIIRAKCFMQSLWTLKLGWDETLPSATLKVWQKLVQDLSQLPEQRIERWLDFGPHCVTSELIGFSDASEKAFSAVAYLRLTDMCGLRHIHLLMAKSRVTPLGNPTIPRLELCGAVLLKDLILHLKSQLGIPFDQIVCFSDSKVVLAWLRKQPSTWGVFVSNRVAAIQKELPEAIWHYVPSQDNPADLNSRGLTSEDFHTSRLWWTGPFWMATDNFSQPNSSEPFDTELEQRKKTVHVARLAPLTLFERVSQWNRLIRAMGYVVRFINLSRGRWTHGESGELSQYELKEAERLILTQLQQRSYPLELKALREGSSVPTNSPLISLNPFLDEYGIIRVGGRLANSSLPELQKHPAILAPGVVTDRLIRYVHNQAVHSGTTLTLGLLRQQYWVMNARSQVKRVVRNCVCCARIKAKLGTQLMGDLPRERCVPSRPFTHSGIDYTGPFKVRTAPGRGHKSYKAWVAVFVCFSTRAIHLEIVSDYTTSAFLAALERFVSRRGVPSTISSDNGTNFQGASRELLQVVESTLKDPSVHSKYALQGLEWKFIPPAAPNFGGLWEAGVKSMKAHLKRAIGEFIPTYEEFQTILCGIESCLNSRPLVSITDDPDSLEVLTPGHFLTGAAIKASPVSVALNHSGRPRSRWRQVVQTTESFWNLWQRDYLAAMQTRNKWRTPKPTLKEGSLVVIRSPNSPPATWPLARVICSIPGPDGQVRVVRVKTATAEYLRPVTQLCLILAEEDSQASPSSSS